MDFMLDILNAIFSEKEVEHKIELNLWYFENPNQQKMNRFFWRGETSVLKDKSLHEIGLRKKSTSILF